MTRDDKPLKFSTEAALEDHMAVHLPRLLAFHGLNLLIVGRQIGAVIDLLAIDATGVLYIIELKLHEASPVVIAQVIDYRRWARRLTREELLSVVARNALHNGLEEAFQQHFGHPIPVSPTNPPVIMIIAESIDQRAARCILELKDGDFAVSTFRYVIQSNAVDLLPLCPDGQDVQSLHAEQKVARYQKQQNATTFRHTASYRVHIDNNTRRFWTAHAQSFVSPLVTFKSVYELYEDWFRTHEVEGLRLPLCTGTQLSRQLVALIAESGEWTRIFIAPGITIDPYKPLADPPSTRTRRDAGHRIVAYQRNAR